MIKDKNIVIFQKCQIPGVSDYNNWFVQDFHGPVSLLPFPNLHMLSKKDELWKNIQKMREKENKENDVLERNSEFWDFLPDTLILPDDWER